MKGFGIALATAGLVAATLSGCSGNDPSSAPSHSSSAPTAIARGNPPVVLDLGKPVVVGAVSTTIEKVQAKFGADKPTYQPSDPTLEWLGAMVRTCVAKGAAPAGPYGWYQFIAVDGHDSWYPGLSWKSGFPLPSNEWPLPQFPTFAQIPSGGCAAGWVLIAVPKNDHITQVVYASGDGKIRAAWRTA